MNVITDCIYLPAQKPPKACQDYAICSSTNEPNPFLIICDGCGSSKDTDIGARLLAHSAKSLFKDLLKNKAPILYQNFGFASIVKANSSSILLGINDQCLDSTMIFAFKNGSYIQAYMYGDGYLFSTGKNGILNFYHQVSYKGNAPHYLSYNLNEERYSLYRNQYINPVDLEIGLFDTPDPTIQKFSDKLTKQLTYFRPSELTETFIIASDGIESFVNLSTGLKISPQEIMNQLTSFKTKKGEFIKRRVRRMMEDYALKGIYNYDDVSVAAFMIGED